MVEIGGVWYLAGWSPVFMLLTQGVVYYDNNNNYRYDLYIPPPRVESVDSRNNYCKASYLRSYNSELFLENPKNNLSGYKVQEGEILKILTCVLQEE